jgi:hypothetical protein
MLATGIPELVTKLQVQGKNVFLVSGGFRQVIHPIAESLNIPVDNVFANNLLFSKVRCAAAAAAAGALAANTAALETRKAVSQVKVGPRRCCYWLQQLGVMSTELLTGVAFAT